MRAQVPVHQRERQRGQATPLVLAVVAVVVVMLVMAGRFAGRVVVEEQAQVAADAAALAGVIGGRPAAERLAAANGGVLVAFTTDGLTAQVTVRIGAAQATARATRAP